MKPSPPVVEREAQRLRSAFDLSFALPPPQSPQAEEDLLAIRVGGDAWAIRLREIAALVAGYKVVAIPSATLHLLGLVGLRGDVVPVFGLSSMLGYGPAPAQPRWMVVCGAEDPIGLAFSDFEGHLRLPLSRLHVGERERSMNNYTKQVASTDSGVRAVIDIPLIVATIRHRKGH